MTLKKFIHEKSKNTRKDKLEHVKVAESVLSLVYNHFGSNEFSFVNNLDPIIQDRMSASREFKANVKKYFGSGWQVFKHLLDIGIITRVGDEKFAVFKLSDETLEFFTVDASKKLENHSELALKIYELLSKRLDVSFRAGYFKKIIRELAFSRDEKIAEIVKEYEEKIGPFDKLGAVLTAEGFVVKEGKYFHLSKKFIDIQPKKK